MTALASPSLKAFAAGLAFLGVFSLLLVVQSPVSEGSILTRTTFFIGLIPPAVCFAAGLALAFWHRTRPDTAGAWVNGAGLVLHGLGMVLLLTRLFG